MPRPRMHSPFSPKAGHLVAAQPPHRRAREIHRDPRGQGRRPLVRARRRRQRMRLGTRAGMGAAAPHGDELGHQRRVEVRPEHRQRGGGEVHRRVARAHPRRARAPQDRALRRQGRGDARPSIPPTAGPACCARWRDGEAAMACCGRSRCQASICPASGGRIASLRTRRPSTSRRSRSPRSASGIGGRGMKRPEASKTPSATSACTWGLKLTRSPKVWTKRMKAGRARGSAAP